MLELIDDIESRSITVLEVSSILDMNYEQVRYKYNQLGGKPLSSIPSEYALYQGDEYITSGTISELAEYTGLSESTIQWYTSPTARIRRPNGKIVIKISN